MQVERNKWITHREAAQLRLNQWAAIVRKVVYWDAPGDKPYHRQPFITPRVDQDRVRAWLDLSERFEEALQTDEWLQDLDKSSPDAFTAISIRYIHGGRSKDQVKEWKAQTGRSRTQYYERLQEGERFVGLLAGISKAF